MPARRSGSHATVQWEEVRRRVAAAGRAIDDGAALSSAEAAEVLTRRARALARPLERRVPDAATLNLVTFMVRNEGYAIEARFVLEVFRPVEVAPLPGAEPPIFGVTAWRGELLPAIDLRSLLDLPSVAPGDRSMVVVLGRERAVLAAPVDALGVMLTVAADAIRSSVGVTTSEYVRGVTPHAALILDIDKILQVAGPEPV